MSLLTTPPECDRDDQLCRAVLRLTGNDWLAAAADWLIAKPLVILGLLLLGFLIRWLAYKLIDRVIGRAAGAAPAVRFSRSRAEQEQAAAAERRQQRAETLASVLRSVASFVLFTVVAMMGLAELGLNIGPLIASAGLVGVALGVGAQSLVKDFLTGLFMFFEDQCGVGDTVEIGDIRGVVEGITLRITRVRAEDGTVWYVRNGEILKVGNISQGGAPPPEAAPGAIPG